MKELIPPGEIISMKFTLALLSHIKNSDKGERIYIGFCPVPEGLTEGFHNWYIGDSPHARCKMCNERMHVVEFLNFKGVEWTQKSEQKQSNSTEPGTRKELEWPPYA